MRRVEALRDKQLYDYLKNKEKLSDLSDKQDEETIKKLSKQIIKLGGKINLDQKDQKNLIKNLSKRLEQLELNSILNDKTKNVICDDSIKNIKVRFQRVEELPFKELRKLVDEGKKDLGEGIVIVFSTKDDKVGLAVGITEKLTEKYDAIEFVRQGSEIIKGKGGGGRRDFAQAGGVEKNNINVAFGVLKNLV